LDEPKRRGRPAKSSIATVTPTTDTTEANPSWPDVEFPTPAALNKAPTPVATGEAIKFETQTNHTHHLYKLEIANFKANRAPDGMQPDWMDNEHVHWFHTITSDGKTQVRTNSVGGHYHKMEVVEQGAGLAPKVKCISGPLKEVVKIQYGKRTRIEVPANDLDNHTHTTKYVKSNVIVERTKNVEAAKAEAQIMSRYQTSVPGVQSDGE